jgi:hypothetical protein
MATVLAVSFACSDASPGGPDTNDPRDASDNGGDEIPDLPGDEITNPDGDVPIERCDPERRVEPVSRDDVTYDEWSSIACLERPCICDGTSEAASLLVEKLLACEAVVGGFYWGQGSTLLQVLGRQDANCVIRILQEVEGGASVHDCTLPFPLSPWPGLASRGDTTMGDPPVTGGIEDRCTLTSSCCIIEGCPDPCGTDVLVCGDLPGWFSPCE